MEVRLGTCTVLFTLVLSTLIAVDVTEQSSSIPIPSQELSDDEIFERIKKKYKAGAISEETFKDFKKRYGRK